MKFVPLCRGNNHHLQEQTSRHNEDMILLQATERATKNQLSELIKSTSNICEMFRQNILCRFTCVACGPLIEWPFPYDCQLQCNKFHFPGRTQTCAHWRSVFFVYLCLRHSQQIYYFVRRLLNIHSSNVSTYLWLL